MDLNTSEDTPQSSNGRCQVFSSHGAPEVAHLDSVAQPSEPATNCLESVPVPLLLPTRRLMAPSRAVSQALAQAQKYAPKKLSPLRWVDNASDQRELDEEDLSSCGSSTETEEEYPLGQQKRRPVRNRMKVAAILNRYRLNGRGTGHTLDRELEANEPPAELPDINVEYVGEPVIRLGSGSLNHLTNDPAIADTRTDPMPSPSSLLRGFSLPLQRYILGYTDTPPDADDINLDLSLLSSAEIAELFPGWEDPFSDEDDYMDYEYTDPDFDDIYEDQEISDADFENLVMDHEDIDMDREDVDVDWEDIDMDDGDSGISLDDDK